MPKHLNDNRANVDRRRSPKNTLVKQRPTLQKHNSVRKAVIKFRAIYDERRIKLEAACSMQLLSQHVPVLVPLHPSNG